MTDSIASGSPGSLSYETDDENGRDSPTVACPVLPWEVWDQIFDALAQIMSVSDMYDLRLVSRMFYELASVKSLRVLRIYVRRNPDDEMVDLISDSDRNWLPFKLKYPDAVRFLYGIHCDIVPPTPSTLYSAHARSSEEGLTQPQILQAYNTSTLRRTKISYPLRANYFPELTDADFPIPCPLLPRLLNTLLLANSHLKSLTLQLVPADPHMIPPTTLRALAPALARVEYLSIAFARVRNAVTDRALPPVPALGEALSEDDVARAPWQLAFAYLARDNLQAMDIKPTDLIISWTCNDPPRAAEENWTEFGTVFPKLETLFVRDCEVDAKSWAYFLRAHRRTVKWVGFKNCWPYLWSYPWSNFTSELMDGSVDLEVLELRRLEVRPRLGIEHDRRHDEILEGLAAGIEKGRNGFRKRRDGLGFAEVMAIARGWFEYKDIRAGWDPIGDILNGGLSDAEAICI